MASTGTLHFGYGSNVWFEQMKERCPESKYIGTAVLRGWRWFVNQRGYANIIRSEGDEVYGFIYELNVADEASLDRSEGVPHSYQKEFHSVHWHLTTGKEGAFNALIYVDNNSISLAGKPKKEYILRINMAMQDGIENGIPQPYVDKYIRAYIPPFKFTVKI